VHGAADPIAPKAERDAFEAEMTSAGARWALLTFGDVVHAFTDPQANHPGVGMYNEPATRHGYALAHAYIAEAFSGKLRGCPRAYPARESARMTKGGRDAYAVYPAIGRRSCRRTARTGARL
jgi:hypothetical protein